MTICRDCRLLQTWGWLVTLNTVLLGESHGQRSLSGYCPWGQKSRTRLSDYTNKKRKKVKSFSRVRLFATPWTVAYQVLPSIGFSRQKYWSQLPFPSPGDLPNPGIKPRSPALQADSLLSELQRAYLVITDTYK